MQNKLVSNKLLILFKNSCSVDCFKIHKNNACSENNQNLDSDQLNKNEFDNSNTNNKPLNLDEYQDTIIDATKLSCLKENQSIMTKLRNKKLQKIIREIDSTKFKKKTLEKMMNDNDFKDFADEILISLGFLKDNIFNY